MKVAQVQFAPWDKIYSFDLNNISLVRGDYVIVKTEIGTEIGKIIGFIEISNNGFFKKKADEKKVKDSNAKNEDKVQTDELKLIIRKATSIDLAKRISKKEKEEALEYCKSLIKKHKLPMKLVDVYFLFDDSRVVFAFIADGRIDFRELVKDLIKHYNCNVRLQQIGIRDEAKLMGDYGRCGRELCCKKFLNNIASITSDMAEIQQVAHRGSERISGICGRLVCCLAFEEKGYEELARRLPPIGIKVNVDGKSGMIVGHNTLKQSVNVEFPGENGENSTIAEVDLNRNKK